jgi:hypothetical protein
MEKEFKTTTVEIRKADLDEFAKFHICRDLRPLHVQRIVEGIEKNGHVLGTIVVNKVHGELKVIDGNHRVEAIKVFLGTHPDGVVKAVFDKYENLGEEDEKTVFLKRNMVVAQNKLDYVQTQCYDTYIYEALIDGSATDFPVKVSLRRERGSTAIPFQRLIEPYLTRGKSSMDSLSSTELIVGLRKLTSIDLRNLAEFAQAYVEIFGPPEPETPQTQALFLIAIQRLYWTAVKQITASEFKNRLKANYPRYHGRIKDLSMLGNAKVLQLKMYELMLECLNFKAKKRVKSAISC